MSPIVLGFDSDDPRWRTIRLDGRAMSTSISGGPSETAVGTLTLSELRAAHDHPGCDCRLGRH